MAVLIAGRRFWLWRAVDDEGEVLDLLVQRSCPTWWCRFAGASRSRSALFIAP
jgi:hypothetical protein